MESWPSASRSKLGTTYIEGIKMNLTTAAKFESLPGSVLIGTDVQEITEVITEENMHHKGGEGIGDDNSSPKGKRVGRGGKSCYRVGVRSNT